MVSQHEKQSVSINILNKIALCGCLALFSAIAQLAPLVAYQICSPEPMVPVDFLVSGLYEARVYHPIPSHIVENMMGRSYKEGCPIPLTDLTYLHVTHYDMQGNVCLGELVVHKKIAHAVMEVFEEIFAKRFPIEKMRLIDHYEANDDLSMEDNNSSAFCYRDVVNKPGFLSKHSFGLAIDINPLWNPYVKGDMIAPACSYEYVNRFLNKVGMLQSGGVVVEAFEKHGFTWGGKWMQIKGYVDFQHFEMDPAIIGM